MNEENRKFVKSSTNQRYAMYTLNFDHMICVCLLVLALTGKFRYYYSEGIFRSTDQQHENNNRNGNINNKRMNSNRKNRKRPFVKTCLRVLSQTKIFRLGNTHAFAIEIVRLIGILSKLFIQFEIK